MLTATQQKEEEDKKVARMKEMELRRQQIAEKRAEEKAREEQRAKLEAEKKKLEREEDTGKKLPVKPPTATKKVSRDDSCLFKLVSSSLNSTLGYRGSFEEAKGGW